MLGLSLVLGDRWLARGFDSEGADALGVRSSLPTLVLLGLLAVAAVAALDAVGGLLVSALFVVPAATTRLVCGRLVTWRAASVALVAAEGIGGLWLSVETNTPPGAAIALLAGGVFVLVAAGRALGPRLAPAAAAGLAALAIAGCGSSNGSGPKVVASTTQLADITRAVAGPGVDVVGILHPNTDPHEYEPRPRDILDTADAKLVIVSGDGLDGWMNKVVDEAGGDPPVLDTGAGVPERLPGDGGGVDPHWWHDPRNVEVAVGRIRDALCEAGSATRGGFAPPRAAYEAKVRALDRGIARCFASVPAVERKLVTDHDAFGYFARRYGIRVIGAVIPAQSTQAQASAGDLARLSKTIRREHVARGLPESSVNARVARAIAAADRGVGGPHPLRGHARARGLCRGDLPGDGTGERRRDDAWLHRWPARLQGGGNRMTAPGERRRSGRFERPAALVDDLVAGYGGAPVLRDVSFEARRGERLAVLGPNGGGKTTLFKVLLGQLAPLAGVVEVPGRAATVAQTDRSRLDYPVSALDVALMGTLPLRPWWRRLTREQRSAALSALEQVDLAGLAHETYGDLSGGQRQRVLIARALVQDADLLLLDEPFTGLDAQSAQRLEALVERLARDGRAVMIATHDLPQARSWDRVLCLNRVQIACGDPRSVLTTDVLQATYGGDLVQLPDGSQAVLPPHHH